MGGINSGPGENNEEREDLRPDTESHEAETAGLALKDIGVNATLNPDDPSDPANFVGQGLDEQDIKDFIDGVEVRHHGAGDRHETILTHNMRGQGDDQHGGHISGTQASEIQKARIELAEQREENRARRIALLAAVGSIADIQTMEQFEQYYEQMGVELQTLEQETEIVRRELDEVTRELDDRIAELEAQIAEDQNRIVDMEPGSEERIQLAIKIRAAEHTLELYQEERAELTEQWQQHSSNLEAAQERMASIQSQIDAGASGQDLERLKAELQQAQDAIETANVSLDRVEQRVDFSEQLLSQSIGIQAAMTEDNAYTLFEVEELRAQAELAEYFLEVRKDGEMSIEELQEIERLRAAGGIDEAGLAKLESMEGENAEAAQNLATALRQAESDTMASLSTSGIGIAQYDEEGNKLDDLAYGEDALSALDAMIKNLANDVQEETVQLAAVEEQIVNPVTEELTGRINTLVQARADQAGNLAFLGETPEVQALDELLTLYNDRQAELSTQFDQYNNEVLAAQQAVRQLEADSNATEAEIQAARDTLASAQAARQDVVEHVDALEDTLTVTEELMGDLEANSNVCNMQGIGHSQLAQAQVAAELIDDTTLTLEQRRERIQEAGNVAFEENKFDYNGSSLLQLPLSASLSQGLTLPNGEIIGSFDTAGGDNQRSSDETLELGTSEADMEASRRVQAQIEGGQITAAQLDQALEMLDVDRATIERKLAEQGVEIVEPDATGITPANSAFLSEDQRSTVGSYAILSPAGPGAIQVPHTPVAEPTVEPGAIAPASYASFADSPDFESYGPRLAGDDEPVMNSAPEVGTAPSAFASAMNQSGTTPTAGATATTGSTGGPSGPTDTASVAAATAAREAELRQAELQAQQNNSDGPPGNGTPGAGTGAGGSTIT